MVVVIDESIVKQLHIDEESWLEHIAISGGIFFETFVQEDTAGGLHLGYDRLTTKIQ